MEEVDNCYRKLKISIDNRSSRSTRLQRWSEFIRCRDGFRCVDCHSTNALSAHHICRKVLFAGAELDTGNGITLCRECHRDVHAVFNRRPDLQLPVDYQEGEKLSLMQRLYSILLEDALERRAYEDRYYYLSDQMLNFFSKMQGYARSDFHCGRLEQAYLMLSEPEWNVRNAIASANGFSISKTPLLPGGSAMTTDLEENFVVFQRYRHRTEKIK